MFIDGHIEKRIADIQNFEDLDTFFHKFSNYILIYKDKIIEKIRTLEKSDSYTIQDIIIFLTKKEYVSKLEFDILTEIVNRNYIWDLLSPEKRNFFILLYSDENIKNDICRTDTDSEIIMKSIHQQRLFIQRIMDIYIASYDPMTIRNVLIPNCFGIRDICENMYSEEFMKEKLSMVSPELQDSLMLTLNYLWDIFSGKIKFEAFQRICRYIYHELEFSTKFWVLNTRYEKYFKENTQELIADILLLWSKDNFMDYLKEFILIMKSMKIDMELSILFIEEIRFFIKIFFDKYSKNFTLGQEELKDFIKTLYQSDEYPKETLDTLLQKETTQEIATEAYKKDSKTMHEAQHKIYKAYKNYKNAEDKIDSQITKALQGAKTLLIGDVKKEVIEGKSYTAIGLLKKALGTAAIFAFGPIKGIIALVIRYALKKSTTKSERRKILMELQAEIEMVEEKIEDARGDGNREAKYALMRTRTELKNAYEKIRLGMEADQRTINTAKTTIDNIRRSL